MCDDDSNADTPVVMRLARELADLKSSRSSRAEVLHTAIAKYVETAQRESGWPRKRIISEARHLYVVSERTVEEAIRRSPAAKRKSLQ